MHQSREHDRMFRQSNSNSFHRSSMIQISILSTTLRAHPLTVFPEPDSNLDGQFCFNTSNCSESIKVSPSSSFVKTHAPHRTFKEVDPDSFTSFWKVESGIDDLLTRSYQVASFFEEISLKESTAGNDNSATFEIRCFQEVHFKGKPCRASNCSWTHSGNVESLDDLTCKDSNEVKNVISDVESKARPLCCNVETSSSTVLESHKNHGCLTLQKHALPC